MLFVFVAINVKGFFNWNTVHLVTIVVIAALLWGSRSSVLFFLCHYMLDPDP